MATNRSGQANGEFRLEGLTLVLVGGTILAAVVGAFFLGAWVERRSRPPGQSPAGLEDPLAQLKLDSEPVDAEQGMDFFDDLGGAEKQAEPAREIPAKRQVRQASPAAEAPAEDGAFHVQVFAGRDRPAAAKLVSNLETAGYRVKLATVRDGQRTLYKVRVGGYADEDRARGVARELLKRGYPGAWVTRID